MKSLEILPNTASNNELRLQNLMSKRVLYGSVCFYRYCLGRNGATLLFSTFAINFLKHVYNFLVHQPPKRNELRPAKTPKLTASDTPSPPPVPPPFFSSFFLSLSVFSLSPTLPPAFPSLSRTFQAGSCSAGLLPPMPSDGPFLLPTPSR